MFGILDTTSRVGFMATVIKYHYFFRSLVTQFLHVAEYIYFLIITILLLSTIRYKRENIVKSHSLKTYITYLGISHRDIKQHIVIYLRDE